MSRFVRWLAAGLTVVWMSFQASAQTQSATPKVVWNLDWIDNHCAITTGSADSMGLSLRVVPGDPDPELYLVGSSAVLAAAPHDKLTVTLAPTGEAFTAVAGSKTGGAKTRVLQVSKLKYKFPGAFSKADTLQVSTRKGSVSMQVKGSAKAMAALQQCIDMKLAEWGVDSKIYDALRKPPTPREGAEGYITGDDYPQSALDRNEQGSVVARVIVDEVGNVASCDVAVSSHSRILDATTCQLIKSRAKFDPAIGSDGKPTQAIIMRQLNWQIFGV